MPERRIPNTIAQAGAGRNQGIDILRGMAVLLVVMGHINLRAPLGGTDAGYFLPRPLIDAAVNNGHNAVFVFFVISGFVITRGAMGRFGALSALRLGEFYANRFARIAPLLVALLLVLSVLHWRHVPGYIVDGHNQTLTGTVAAALGLYLNVYEARTAQLPIAWTVLWSLSIEEIFYLGYPLACRLLRPPALLLGAAAVLAASLPFLIGGISYANMLWHFKATLPGIAAIATGVASAMLAGRLNQAPRWIGTALLIAGSSALTASLGWNGTLWRHLGEGWTMLVLTIGTAGLLAALSTHGRAAWRWAPLLPLAFTGSLSYEIYLTHAFVVNTTLMLFTEFGVGQRYGWMCYIAAVPCAFAVGWLVAKLFTRPVGQTTARFLNHLGGARTLPQGKARPGALPPSSQAWDPAGM
jgi:peptidoglycan/LPS O-acetylase OafA/YrhL